MYLHRRQYTRSQVERSAYSRCIFLMHERRRVRPDVHCKTDRTWQLCSVCSLHVRAHLTYEHSPAYRWGEACRRCLPARALKASRASMASGSSARSGSCSGSGCGSGTGSGSGAVSRAISSASSFSCARVFLTSGGGLHALCFLARSSPSPDCCSHHALQERSKGLMCPITPSLSYASTTLCRVRVISSCLLRGYIKAGVRQHSCRRAFNERAFRCKLTAGGVTLHSFNCSSDAAEHAVRCMSHGKARCRCDGRSGSPLLPVPLGFGAGAAAVLRGSCCSLLLHGRLGQRLGLVCWLLSRRGSLRQRCLLGHAGRKACMHRHSLERLRRRCAPCTSRRDGSRGGDGREAKGGQL